MRLKITSRIEEWKGNEKLRILKYLNYVRNFKDYETAYSIHNRFCKYIMQKFFISVFKVNNRKLTLNMSA